MWNMSPIHTMMKAGMRLRRTSLATVLYRPDWYGLHCGRSRRKPAEIGDGKDNIEVAAFTGDFIDDMETPIGTRASEGEII